MKLLIFAICALILGLGAFWGFIRRSNRALVRLITLIGCVVLAFFLAKSMADSVGNYVVDYLRQALLSDPEFASYLEENPTLLNSLSAVCEMLVAPLLFFLLYVVLKLLTLLVYGIVCLIFHVKGPNMLGLGRLLGAGLGLLCGVIGAVVFVTPVCGYCTLLDSATTQMDLKSSENATVQQLASVTECKDAALASLLYDTVGVRVFDGLTTTQVSDTESISLKNELSLITGLLENVLVLRERSIENYGEAEVTAVSNVAANIDNSVLLSNVSSGALAGFSNAWLQGDAFLGVSRPAVEGELGGIFDAFLQVFATSNSANIGQDLQTFADVFGLLVQHELFALLTAEDETAFANKLLEPGVVEDFYNTLESNPRMLPVKMALADAGMRLLLDQLGAPETLRDSHGALMNEMAGVLKGAVDGQGNIDLEKIEAGLEQTLNNHEVTVPDGAVQLVSEALTEEFSPQELQSLNTDEVIDRLIARFSGAQIALPVS